MKFFFELKYIVPWNSFTIFCSNYGDTDAAGTMTRLELGHLRPVKARDS